MLSRRHLLPLTLLAPWPLRAGTGVVAYCEEWPPYCYASGGGMTGFAVELLQAMCQRCALALRFELRPWKRAMREAEREARSLLFPTARTAERESLFLWVGPLAPRQLWIFGRRSVSTLAALQGRIAVVRDDAAVAELLAAGVPRSLMDESPDIPQVMRRYLAGQVDYFYDTELSAAWQLRDRPDAAMRLMRFGSGGEYFYALQRVAEPALAAQLQRALDELRQEGWLEQLHRRYARALLWQSSGS
ncbi:MAG: transporter substrate-binding domain-containing protein [Inhella sp.]